MKPVDLSGDHAASLRRWFAPERPGPLVGLHVLNTESGRILVDRWPEPRTVFAISSDNCALLGDPDHVSFEEMPRPAFVAAAERFVPLLRRLSDEVHAWDRVVYELSGRAIAGHPRPARRLGPSDRPALERLSPDVRWISNTWGGHEGLARSGRAWGIFAGDVLATVAVPFYVGDRYEDIGVVTEPAYRGRGYSPACAAALCADIQRRGRTPTWSTSPDNAASLRVAQKLGFRQVNTGRLYVVGMRPPAP